jgi:hypothetical protein
VGFVGFVGFVIRELFTKGLSLFDFQVVDDDVKDGDIVVMVITPTHVCAVIYGARYLS